MSDQTNEANPEAGTLYGSDGQVIRHDQPHRPKQGTGGEVMKFIHEQPLAAVAIAFGLGYFVGKII